MNVLWEYDQRLIILKTMTTNICHFTPCKRFGKYNLQKLKTQPVLVFSSPSPVVIKNNLTRQSTYREKESERVRVHAFLQEGFFWISIQTVLAEVFRL